MSSTDILQDVHDREQMPKVNKIRLFLVHTIAIVSMSYLGIAIGTVISMPSFASFDADLHHFETGEYPKREVLRFWNLFIRIASYTFTGTGVIISIIICRKQKLPFIIPFAIILYSFIVLWVAGQIPYVGLLFPGTYVLRYLGWNIGPIVNTIYLAIIIWFLFFSKKVKRWWLQPLVE